MNLNRVKKVCFARWVTNSHFARCVTTSHAVSQEVVPCYNICCVAPCHAVSQHVRMCCTMLCCVTTHLAVSQHVILCLNTAWRLATRHGVSCVTDFPASFGLLRSREQRRRRTRLRASSQAFRLSTSPLLSQENRETLVSKFDEAGG